MEKKGRGRDRGEQIEGARALSMEGEIGSLEAGRIADVCVWDWAVGPVATHRDRHARGLHERLFAWMILADERNLVESRVAGMPRYQRGDAPR